MIFKGIFPYPPMFDVLADELAKLRSDMSKDVYSKGTEKYRGEREHELSKMGILGELIARDYLSLRPIKFRCAPLVDFRPVVEPDIILTDVHSYNKIDVKCAKEGAKDFYINYDAFNNPEKDVNVYWFVKLERHHEASHYLVKDVDVANNWKVKQTTYTKVYTSKIIDPSAS